MPPNSELFENEKTLEVKYPFTVTTAIANKLVKKNEDSGPPPGMYL